MATIIDSYKAAPIEVIGDDMVVDGVALPIAQKLVFKRLAFNENPQAYEGVDHYMPGSTEPGSSVAIEIQVLAYKKNADGTLGARWKGNRDYVYHMIANNTTWVISEGELAGKIVGLVGDEKLDEHTREALYDANGVVVQTAGKLAGLKIIRENEFFERLSDVADINVRGLIRSYIVNNKGRVQPYKN